METLPAFFLQSLFLAVMGAVFCAVWVLFWIPLRIIGQRHIPRALWLRLLVLHSLTLSVILGLLWSMAYWVYLIFLGYDTSQYRALQLSVLVFVSTALVSVLFAVLYDGGARRLGITYSQFASGLRKAQIGLDRKVLADMAVHDFEAFTAVVQQVKAKLAA